MLINIPMMRGEVPRLKPHLLANEAATIAIDCEFERGVIAPLTDDKPVKQLSIHADTIFKYTEEHWFTWSKIIEAIHNPMAQDQWKRVYYTGDGKPKITAHDIAIGPTSPAASYDLGVPAPETELLIDSIDGSTGSPPLEGEPANFDDETRYYIHTYVTRFGEEGAPGPPSRELLIEKPGSTVTISIPRPNNNRHNITHTRIYRTVTSSGAADYMLVAELPIATNKYADKEKTINAPILETWDFTPPDEKMRGLCVMANGICAGFAGNEVMFSEAYLPYAWPKSYRGTTEHEIVAIGAIGTSLVVATKGYPYVFSGVTPSAVNGVKLNSEQSCVSAQSMAVMLGYVVYASPDGLVSVSSEGATVMTEQLMTREQWQELKPHTIKGYAVNGTYVAMYDGGAFVFDPVSQDFRQLTNAWDCGVADLENDRLMIVKGNQLEIWKGSSAPIHYIWRSKVFQLPIDSLMSCARVVSRNPELLAVKIIADGAVIYSIEVGELDDRGFRIPSIRGTDWQIEVSGKAEVERLMLASSMQELV